MSVAGRSDNVARMTTTPTRPPGGTTGIIDAGDRALRAAHRGEPVRPWTLRMIVLASGTATMALQMATVRLLAPWFGASSLVWATTIGLSLLAMSIGYLVGGRLGDRRPAAGVLGLSLCAAGVLIAVIPMIAPSLLPNAALGITDADGAAIIGTAVSVLTLSFLPAVLLGMTPPFAIRLALRAADQGGITAGRLYALSTVGSIIGTLVTALVLVQAIGTRATFIGIGALLVLVGLLARELGGTGRPARSEGDVVAAGTDAAPSRGVLAVPLALAIVFVEGVAMMAGEMGIARLVAPFFGASSIVWANIIAIVMGCIAIGSWLGGRLADRRPTRAALAVLLGAAACAMALLPFVASPVMRLSTGGIDAVAIGTVVGSFLATLVVLVVPVTLLGMIPPFVLRLAIRDVDHAGSLAGRLYATSTAGALVGTFASALWLIPAVGVRRTLLLAATLLALLPLLVVARRMPVRRFAIAAAPLALVAALALAPTGLVKPLDDGRVLDEAESRYQFIQVVEDGDDGRRLLQLNEGWAVHSIWDPRTVLTGGIWDHFLVLPSLLDDVPDADVDFLVVGNAAGTAARAYDELRPDVRVEGVELDPDVTRVGRRWFHLPDDQRIHTADGRPFLRAAKRESWNVIHVDAYRQPYIPFYLATREFFALAKSRLQPGGILSINVGSTPKDPRIVDAIAATMRAEFPTVVRYRAEEYNELIVGVDDPDVDVDELRRRLETNAIRDRGDAVNDLFTNFATGLRDVRPNAARVLTDDRAPVEWMTDRMIFGETS